MPKGSSAGPGGNGSAGGSPLIGSVGNGCGGGGASGRLSGGSFGPAGSITSVRPQKLVLPDLVSGTGPISGGAAGGGGAGGASGNTGGGTGG